MFWWYGHSPHNLLYNYHACKVNKDARGESERAIEPNKRYFGTPEARCGSDNRSQICQLSIGDGWVIEACGDGAYQRRILRSDGGGDERGRVEK